MCMVWLKMCVGGKVAGSTPHHSLVVGRNLHVSDMTPGKCVQYDSRYVCGWEGGWVNSVSFSGRKIGGGVGCMCGEEARCTVILW